MVTFGGQLQNYIMLDRIEDAIEDIRRGKVVIVVDDEDRENEGDFVAAAETVTPEMVNFMATHGRGLICAPLTEERCEALDLELMVGKNTATYETPFTISVDLIGHGCTTGISASDRAKTIKALVNSETKPEDLGRPGHIFPLKAKKGGVLRRTGHTEASIDLARLAGFEPAGVIVEIMNEDGSMARLPQLREIANRFGLKLVSIEDLISYRLAKETLIEKKEEVEIDTAYGAFKVTAFVQKLNGQVHLALSKGEWTKDEVVLTRMHSSTSVSDLFDLLTSPNVPLIERALMKINESGKGLMVYLNMEHGSESLINRIENYKNGVTNGPLAGVRDDKDFGIGAQILRAMGVHKMNLLSNHPTKRKGLEAYGIEIVDYIEL